MGGRRGRDATSCGLVAQPRADLPHVMCGRGRATSGPPLSQPLECLGATGCGPYKYLYNIRGDHQEARRIPGESLDDLRAFPVSARRESGHQLDQVQQGLQPDDWKPMPSIGSGVQEIRVRDAAGAFRVIYVAKFSVAIYVLHCFQKKTPKTSRADVELARQRYRDLVKELNR